MTDDNKLWLGTWGIVGFVLVCIAASARSCNESDNKLYSAVVKQGCSVVQGHNGREIICKGFTRKAGIEP